MKHIFELNLDWKQKNNSQNHGQKIYIKSHEISIKGKDLLNVSAAKIFKGDPELLNPEDLLLSSLTSCHFMSFLYCCEQHQIKVISYSDSSEAILETTNDESGKITKVILKPRVVIENPSQIDLANSLHKKANELCFIANSCNFPIEHFPTTTSENLH